MSQDAAGQIVALMLRQRAEQQRLLADIRTLCQPADFDRYAQMIGGSIRAMADVIEPIVAEHPDLRQADVGQPVQASSLPPIFPGELHVAERLMESLLRFDRPLNEATEVASEISDETERRRVLRVIGTMMGDIYIELMRPIIRRYPDLDPDGPGTGSHD